MQLGMIGLGRMGGNIVRRLMKNGHDCVVFDTNAGAVAQLAGEGAAGAADLAQLVQKHKQNHRHLNKQEQLKQNLQLCLPIQMQQPQTLLVSLQCSQKIKQKTCASRLT